MAKEYPSYCMIRGIGRCRVLSYWQNGYFRVLDKNDETRLVHRSRMKFLPDAPPTITRSTQEEKHGKA